MSTQHPATEVPGLRQPPNLRADFVEAYGHRAFVMLGGVGALFLLPFSLNNFVEGRALLGVATLLVATCLFVNAIAIAARGVEFFPRLCIFALTLAALALAMYGQGLVGILWAYAAILLFHFVLPRRTANLFNATIVLLGVAMAWLHLEPHVTARVGVTLLITLMFTNLFWTVADAQQRRETEQRERLELLVRGTNAGILEWDAGGSIVCSRRFLMMLGLAPGCLTGADEFLEMVHPDDRPRLEAQWRHQFEVRGRPRTLLHLPADEFRLARSSGETLWVHVESLAVRNRRGATHRVICTFMDVTERVQSQEALMRSHEEVQRQARLLERQNLALRDAMRVREEVERIARHDLKTPLASIASVPRLLREGRDVDAREEELLSMVERASRRVLSMVNLSLDLYRMETGSYEARLQNVELAEVVQSAADDLREQAASKHVHLVCEADAALPPALGEELLCYSVVANLLKNAVEAAPDGSRVRLQLRSEAGDAGEQVCLRIHNEGAVPPAVRDTFFRKYGTHGKTGGTGLGAYSARLMAAVQGGKLQMHTSDAEGTTLTLRLPAAVRKQLTRATVRQEHAAPQEPADQELTFLLVDDDPYNLLMVRHLLRLAPTQVHTAVNGRAAVEHVQRTRPDVILLDLQMPVMGGREAVRCIRESQGMLGHAPSFIVALSAMDDAQERDDCLQAGFDDCIVKPATREQLQAMVRSAREKRPGVRAMIAPQSTRERSSLIAPLLPEFVESRRLTVGELQHAAAASDREAMHRIAHLLAGSFGMYGFERCSQMSREIEALAQEGELAALRERCARLATCFEQEQDEVLAAVTA